jgi:hypothetical protein
MEDRMGDTIDVTIPVEPEAAAALRDARNRAAIGRLVSRVLHPRPVDDPLVEAIARLKAEVSAAELTDAEVDAELDAYNAERRSGSFSTHRHWWALRSSGTACPNVLCCERGRRM